MIKDLVCELDYSICAEVALAVFFAAFAGIIASALWLSSSAAKRFASIPISDAVEDSRDE